MNYMLSFIYKIINFYFKDIENDIIGKSDMTTMNVVSENKSLLEQLLIDIPADSDGAKKSLVVSTRSTRSHRYYILIFKICFDVLIFLYL